MIIIKSTLLKNEPMNIRGVDLFFDETGTCRDVPKHLAILITPMKGFIVTGMDEDTDAAAKQRAEDLEHEKNTQKPGYARGIPFHAHTEQPQGFQTNVPGRMMEEVKTEEPRDEAEEMVAKYDQEALAKGAPPQDVVEEEDEPSAPLKTFDKAKRRNTSTTLSTSTARRSS